MSIVDIKASGQYALYELLGGKSRFAITTYCHADGKTVEETSDNVSKFVEAGWKHVRIQLGGYGSPLLGRHRISKVPDSACLRTNTRKTSRM